MIDALNTAINGMKTAGSQLDGAANTIVRAGAAASAETGQITSTGAVASPAVINSTGTRPQDNLLQGVVDLQQAALSYKANVKVVETASEMEKTVIDSLR